MGIKLDDNKSLDYLSRTFYRQYPDTEIKEIIYSKINLLFYGNETDIYDSLLSLVVSDDVLGVKIDANYLNQFYLIIYL